MWNFPLENSFASQGVRLVAKSTLINDTLQPILAFLPFFAGTLPYDQCIGGTLYNKVVKCGPVAAGQDTRSNLTTYTGVFSDIRNLFVGLPKKDRGFISRAFLVQ